MTIEHGRKCIADALDQTYESSEIRKSSELLLEHITGLSAIDQVIKRNEILDGPQSHLLIQAIDRLRDHEPIQYVIKEAWFAGMKFYVDRNVLIPRPETEELMDWVVRENKERHTPFRILDVGTGSGCLAIALKREMPQAEVWGCDISVEALQIARMNADSLDAAVDFIPVDFLDNTQRQQLPEVHIIVSNPPYIPLSGRSEMEKNVTDYEPSIALFVPDDAPLLFYSALVEFAKEKLHSEGMMYVETHEAFGERVKTLFAANGFEVKLRKDLQGKDRMVCASRQ